MRRRLDAAKTRADHGGRAGAEEMRRSSWIVLLTVAIVGWTIAGVIALLAVTTLGWFGVMLLGLVTLVVALRVELDEEFPGTGPWASAHLMRRQLEQQSEGTAEARLARFAERVERQRWLYIVRTVGIALALLGLNMWALRVA
jgi:hypothetical protein